MRHKDDLLSLVWERTVGQYLQKHRLKRGLTLEKLACAARHVAPDLQNLSSTALGEYENGRLPEPKQLRVLLIVLSVPGNELAIRRDAARSARWAEAYVEYVTEQEHWSHE